jgi:hypothetical protein
VYPEHAENSDRIHLLEKPRDNLREGHSKFYLQKLVIQKLSSKNVLHRTIFISNIEVNV